MLSESEYSKIPKIRIKGPKLLKKVHKKDRPVAVVEIVLYKYVVIKITDTTRIQYPAIMVATLDVKRAINNIEIPIKNKEEYIILNQSCRDAIL